MIAAFFGDQKNRATTAQSLIQLWQTRASHLRGLILADTGNRLAYSLYSFSKILEVDMGWQVLEVAG